MFPQYANPKPAVRLQAVAPPLVTKKYLEVAGTGMMQLWNGSMFPYILATLFRPPGEVLSAYSICAA